MPRRALVPNLEPYGTAAGCRKRPQSAGLPVTVSLAAPCTGQGAPAGGWRP
jgi:hypothetical protein